jgi:DNA-binding response OmpR family regulator
MEPQLPPHIPPAPKPGILTMMLVEDEPTLQELYSERFIQEGFAVISAKDGEEAISQLEAHPEINLVILDLMLPKISGFDVLNYIKHHPQTSHLPVIIVSALADIDDQARGLQLGATDYITKGEMLPADVIAKIKGYALKITPAQASNVAA